MNQRFLELAELCSGDYDENSGGLTFSERQLEKYARAIIEECLFIPEHMMTKQLECSWDEGYVTAQEQVISMIKEHFGMNA